jgi:murein DD-endopeptidase MepM/ murein hydrolase activator NlpD
MAIHQLLFPQLRQYTWKEINLNEEAKSLPVDKPNPLLDAGYCQEWVYERILKHSCSYCYGGYLEDRSVLWRGHYQKAGHAIHLGTDFTVIAGTYVYAPFSGKVVHCFHDDDTEGGWGGRIIVEHAGGFCLFGHLSHLELRVGQEIHKGGIFAKVGTKEENGNWFPHLHIQGISPRMLHLHSEDLRTIDGYSHMYKGIEEDWPEIE